ncbi:MAG TPA: GTP-binding protein [Xanthobacteraceae bacterium]|nr:GTP-binding protein [Xanthobacteraceae bacterium]
MADARIPLTIVTGFLGSGKTTLLREILVRPEMTDTLILMNEVAEIGIDDRLLKRLTGDTVLLDNGCVCCSVKDDLKRVLLEIAEAPPGGRAPRRIVLETTGLADPRAFLATIVGTPMIGSNIRLNGVLTLVDSVNARRNLADFPEFTGQLTVADYVLLTKADLVSPEEMTGVQAIVTKLNPAATVTDWSGLDRLCDFLNGGSQSGALLKLAETHASHHIHHHHADAHSFCITLREACDWSRFAIWLSMFVHAHGEDILRIKGILYLESGGAPVAINCVQHLVYFPEHLPLWPGEERSSVLVFILRNITQDAVMRSLNDFLARAPALEPARA